MDLTVPLIDHRNIYFSIGGRNIKLYGRSPNSDDRSRRSDFHVAGFCDLAGDEASGALHQRDER